MQTHPYMRAYLAGIAIPTLFLLIITAVWASLPFYLEVPSQFIFEMPAPPLERALILPIAIVPNAWGLWNMLYLLLGNRPRLPLAIHGALLPVLMFPAGIVMTRVLDAFTIQWHFALPALALGMAIYYLVWKHAVAALNMEMGIA